MSTFPRHLALVLGAVTLTAACSATTTSTPTMSSSSSKTIVRQFSSEAEMQLASDVLMEPARAGVLTRDAVRRTPRAAAQLVAAAVSVAPEQQSVIAKAAIEVVPAQADAIKRAVRDAAFSAARDASGPTVLEIRPR